MVSPKQLLASLESALLGSSPPTASQRVEVLHAIRSSLHSFQSLLSYPVSLSFFFTISPNRSSISNLMLLFIYLLLLLLFSLQSPLIEVKFSQSQLDFKILHLSLLMTRMCKLWVLRLHIFCCCILHYFLCSSISLNNVCFVLIYEIERHCFDLKKFRLKKLVLIMKLGLRTRRKW